jgi:DNA-binding NtrC family response regulator
MTARLLETEGLDEEVRRAEDARSVVVVSADMGLRQRLASSLLKLRWRVREASGGAEAMQQLEAQGSEAMLLDGWLPDLEVGEFAAHVRLLYPEMDLVPLDSEREGELSGALPNGVNPRVQSARRNELFHAMREAKEGPPDALAGAGGEVAAAIVSKRMRGAGAYRVVANGSVTDGSLPTGERGLAERVVAGRGRSGMQGDELLPELVGRSPAMRDVARLVRQVAPRSTTVLIEGETGTGKEVVARALHRLSLRAARPFAVLNCAAIPEALLEAELFGHTRGAFTGAVQARMGRIEMAHGGTLLLDEIGEMPVGMQAKMLRFLESGELQRVGDNEVTRVDVRLIAATHQRLEEMCAEGTFRLDLYHRLAVFPIELPPLRERMEDIAALAEHFLGLLGKESPRKRLGAGALERLREHRWPGNVRELMHVLERGVILAGVNPEIAAEEIRYRRAART